MLETACDASGAIVCGLSGQPGLVSCTDAGCGVVCRAVPGCLACRSASCRSVAQVFVRAQQTLFLLSATMEWNGVDKIFSNHLFDRRYWPELDRGAGAALHFACDHGQLAVVKFLVSS